MSGIHLKDKFEQSVSLLCWAFNEELIIDDFLKKASKLMEECVADYEIILIDDGSIDRTFEIASAFQNENPRLKIFRNGKNLNIGISSRRAIQKATKDFLFWQTVDWCYDISRLREHLDYLKTYNIVQGVRRRPVKVKIGLTMPFMAFLAIFGIKHITKRSDTIAKAFVSIINYILIRMLFRIPVSDLQNVTFYPTKWIQSINLEGVSSFANPEGLIKSYWHGKSIKEVAIDFIPRAKGRAKGTKLISICRSVKEIFRLWFKLIVLGKRGKIRKGKVYRLGF